MELRGLIAGNIKNRLANTASKQFYWSSLWIILEDYFLLIGLYLKTTDRLRSVAHFYYFQKYFKGFKNDIVRNGK